MEKLQVMVGYWKLGIPFGKMKVYEVDEAGQVLQKFEGIFFHSWDDYEEFQITDFADNNGPHFNSNYKRVKTIKEQFQEQIEVEEIKIPTTIKESMAILREASRRMRALQRKEDIENGLL